MVTMKIVRQEVELEEVDPELRTLPEDGVPEPGPSTRRGEMRLRKRKKVRIELYDSEPSCPHAHLATSNEGSTAATWGSATDSTGDSTETPPETASLEGGCRMIRPSQHLISTLLIH